MILLDQLVEFYYLYDKFQETYMSPEEAFSYHETLIRKNRLGYVLEQGILLGYVEHYAISFEQLGRMVAGIPINIETEDIENGEVALCANITIHPRYRKGYVIKELTRQFFNANIECNYYVGHAQHRTVGMWKRYKKQESYKKWAQQEEILNGLY